MGRLILAGLTYPQRAKLLELQILSALRDRELVTREVVETINVGDARYTRQHIYNRMCRMAAGGRLLRSDKRRGKSIYWRLPGPEGD